MISNRARLAGVVAVLTASGLVGIATAPLVADSVPVTEPPLIVTPPTVAAAFRGSGANTGVGSGAITERPGLLWSFDTGGELGYPGQPVRLGDTIYVGCGNGNVYAIDARSGEERWRFRTGGGVYASPLVHDGVVIVGSYDGAVHGIDAVTGARRWRVATSDVIESSACLTTEGLAVVGSFDHNVYAIDARSGKIRWTTDMGDAVYGSPACSAGRIYVGAGDRLLALDETSGAVAWTAALDEGDYVSLAPAVADGKVVIAGQTGQVYAFDAGIGTPVWKADSGGRIRDAVAIADDTVFSCSLGGTCTALSLADGGTRWSTRWLHQPAGSPVFAGGILYLPANAGGSTVVYALEASTGRISWDFRLAGTTRSSPMLYDGLLLVGTESGVVNALSAEARRMPRIGGHTGVTTHRGDLARTGSAPRAPEKLPRVLWTARAGEGTRPSSGPVMAGGLVLVPSTDGFLYAFDAASGEEVWRYSAGGVGLGSPTVADGIVYLASEGGHLTSLDLFSGTRRWSTEIRDEAVGAPCIAADQVITGTKSGRVYARSLESGRARWDYRLPGPVPAEVACTVGVAYVTSSSGSGKPAHLVALNASSGASLWDVELDKDAGEVSGPVSITNRVLVATSKWIYSFESMSGRRMWRARSPGTPVSSPAVAGGLVFSCASPGDGSCTAYRLSSGGVIWRARLGSVAGPPLAGGKLVLAPVAGGGRTRLAALHSSSGKETWSLDLGKATHLAPALAEGIILVAAADGAVYLVGDVLPVGVRVPRPEVAGDARRGYALFRGTKSRSGVFPGKAPKRPGELWRARAGRDIGWPGQPTVFDGRVFVGSGSPGGIFAFAVRTGDEIWEYKTDGGVYTSPTYWNGLVIAGSYDRSVYALDAKTGKLRWKLKTGGIIEAAVCVAKGIAYAASFDGRIYALEATSGRELWSYNARGSLDTSPTCEGGTVYGAGVGDSSPGQLFALSAESGRELWVLPLKEKPTLAIVAHGDALYMSGGGGSIYVVEKATGTLLRIFDGPGPGRDAIAVADERLYACATTGDCAAYEVGTGKEIWSARVGKSSRGSPLVTGGLLIAQAMDLPSGGGGSKKPDKTYVVGLDARTGLERWRVEVDGSTRTSPGCYDGVVYVGTETGHLYAIGDESEKSGRSSGRR